MSDLERRKQHKVTYSVFLVPDWLEFVADQLLERRSSAEFWCVARHDSQGESVTFPQVGGGFFVVVFSGDQRIWQDRVFSGGWDLTIELTPRP